MDTVELSRLSSIAIEREVCERARLLIDLDEATGPSSDPTVLVIVGVAPRPFLGPDTETAACLERLEARFDEIAANGLTIYRPRSTEVCVLLDGPPQIVAPLLRRIRSAIDAEGQSARLLSMGSIALPNDASNATDALSRCTLARR